jgi:hypothetical protein
MQKPEGAGRRCQCCASGSLQPAGNRYQRTDNCRFPVPTYFRNSNWSEFWQGFSSASKTQRSSNSIFQLSLSNLEMRDMSSFKSMAVQDQPTAKGFS